ncbi:hypothetical protein M413DRAFT_448291 [Hebeloma cylindrosporum]|uniref:Uncharacterized protein n=1 Tax=Hebeloma cylindrosporum TaxID=76867 RepID=A0A0C2XIY7_HEBCY|nr:hypothetical protein M413DRAFT_448291 [Hebeloma cylindrosporum h7]
MLSKLSYKNKTAIGTIGTYLSNPSKQTKNAKLGITYLPPPKPLPVANAQHRP